MVRFHLSDKGISLPFSNVYVEGLQWVTWAFINPLMSILRLCGI